MLRSWGRAWGTAWARAWGGGAPTPPVIYMRAPEVEEDEPKPMSVMRIVTLWTGAQQSGLARSSVVKPTT
jgi:hypothetical protein